MASKLFYLWRLFWTPIAFAALGVGGLVLAWTVIPAATIFERDKYKRNRTAQAIIRQSFRLYLWCLQTVGIIRLEVSGADQFRDCHGKLVVANHPTLLDIVILMALLPDAKCVGKEQLWRNPMLRFVVSAAGYIRNDHEPEVFLAKCRETLAAGFNLIIFPEGTRTVPGRPLHFQRGFAHIALASGVDLLPIVITCEPVFLVKGDPFYKVPLTRPRFRIEAGRTLLPRSYSLSEAGSRSLDARALVSQIEADYYRKLSHG